MSRLESRTSRLRRLEELLVLKTEGLRARELAQQLKVDRRTIYRDLDFLCEQGVPVWQADGRFGINRTRYLSTVHLSFHESIALVLAGLLLSRTIDERNQHVAAALRKLATTLPQPLTTHLERAAERVQRRVAGQQHTSTLEAIAEGWGTGRKVEVGYRSPRSGVLRLRVLSPYALEPTPSGIYIIGYDDWAGDIRTFKLNRLESAAVLDEPFTIPNDFDAEAFLETGWRVMAGEETQEVMLSFTAKAAPHVAEHHWHPTQQLTWSEDGGCVLRLEVAEPLEMKPWIRSWGAQAEILAPDWLRAEIATELRQAAARYENEVSHQRP